MQRISSLSLVLLLVLLSDRPSRAADEATSDKELRREAEAAAEERLNPEASQRNPLLRGTILLLSAEHAEEPNIIGLFVTDQRRFRLEVAEEKLKAELRKFSKQPLALRGKIRDQGATFIAEGIEWGGPPPGMVRNPDGL